MNLSPQLSATTPTTPNILNDDVFYSIIDRLKSQKALSSEDFASENLSKEAQLEDLYKTLASVDLHAMLKKMMESVDSESSDLIKKRLSASQVMSFAHVILYKVLPCPKQECMGRPRETVIQNQYKDYEYECPFYHHEKDKRRMVITDKVTDEFVFKANYSENKGEDSDDKAKCSQNHFESVYHPLYYKLFKCKREHCNVSVYCPFYHTEEEKKTWDRSFSNYIRKDRISYVKEKQKYYENKNGSNNNYKKNFYNKRVQNINTENTRICRAGSDKTFEFQDNSSTNTASPNGITQTQSQQPKTSTFQRTVIDQPVEGEWAAEKNVKLDQIKPWGNKKGFVKRFIEKDAVNSSASVTSNNSSDVCDSEKSGLFPSRGWRSNTKRTVERND